MSWLTCSACGKDSGLDGRGSGWWECETCGTLRELKRRVEAIERTRRSRDEIGSGKRQGVLCPIRRFPLGTTDREAQRWADENYGIRWERTDEEIIVWGEM
jgi:hypothetical protein